jgi:amidophosphoribosyltransferase
MKQPLIHPASPPFRSRPSPDRFQEECAVFGIFGHREAANLTYLGLYALQHRGQEGAGIVSSDGERFHQHKGLGLVADIFSKKSVRNLNGTSAIGHNRYSTAGSGDLHNVQPLVVNFAFGNLGLAHNGNLINAGVLRGELEAYGAIFQSDSDSEVVIHLIAHSKGDTMVNRVIDALSLIRGAFSVVILTDDHLIAARDPYGFRPLCLGRYKGSWVVASETCAFDLIGAEFVREVEPGEMVAINRDGQTSYHPFSPQTPAQCIFEYVYFARPDSKIFGSNAVYPVRKAFGRQLAKECPAQADIVIPVPDSGVPAALGYAEGLGLAFEIGLTRNHYVGRTFIEPEQAIRHFGVKLKLNPVPEVLEGKRVVVVDDSIVRGTTSRKIVKMLRQAGAREIHMRISSPPVVAPCFYGIDTPTQKELIGSKLTVEDIRKYITADSLGYLSLEGMLHTAPGVGHHYCHACFTDRYPITMTKAEQLQLGLFEPDKISRS